jgi:DNA-binding XRE family transcriptional regulator
MTSGKTISENIKKARAKPGLTQDDLARKSDFPYTTQTKIEPTLSLCPQSKPL